MIRQKGPKDFKQKKYILTTEGSFYVSCTLDTCLYVIRQRLIWALSFLKRKVGLTLPQNRLQDLILPLPVCA